MFIKLTQVSTGEVRRFWSPEKAKRHALTIAIQDKIRGLPASEFTCKVLFFPEITVVPMSADLDEPETDTSDVEARIRSELELLRLENASLRDELEEWRKPVITPKETRPL
jgi:hypothetical protein